MAEDLAGLGIKVTSSDVPVAAERLDKLARSAVGAEKATVILGKSFSTMKSHLMSMSTLVGGLSFAALIKGIYDVGTTYEVSMAKIRGTTGATTAEMGKINKVIRDIGDNSDYGATGAAEAFKDLINSGYSVSESIGMLPGVLKMAKIGNLELGEAVESTKKVLTAFGLQVTDQDKVLDSLTITSHKTGTGIGAISQALALAAPYAANFGISLDEMTSYIGVMAKQGKEGGRAAMELVTALQNLPKMLDDMGMSGKGKSLLEIMDMLKQAGKSAEDIEKKFPGRGATSIFRLFDQQTLIKQIQEAEKGGKGAAEAYFEAIEDTTKEGMEVLKSMAKGIEIDIFGDNKNQVRTSIAELTGWVKENRSAIVQFAGDIAKFFSDIIRGAGDARNLLNEVGGSTSGMLSDLKTGWDGLPNIIKDIGLIGAIAGGGYGKAALLLLVEASGAVQGIVSNVKNMKSTSTHTENVEQLQASRTFAKNKLAELKATPAAVPFIDEVPGIDLTASQARQTKMAASINAKKRADIAAWQSYLDSVESAIASKTVRASDKGFPNNTREHRSILVDPKADTAEATALANQATARASAANAERLKAGTIAAQEAGDAKLTAMAQKLQDETLAIESAGMSKRSAAEKAAIEKEYAAKKKMFVGDEASLTILDNWKAAKMNEIAARQSALDSAKEGLKEYQLLWDNAKAGLSDNPYIERMNSVTLATNKQKEDMKKSGDPGMNSAVNRAMVDLGALKKMEDSIGLKLIEIDYKSQISKGIEFDAQAYNGLIAKIKEAKQVEIDRLATIAVDRAENAVAASAPGITYEQSAAFKANNKQLDQDVNTAKWDTNRTISSIIPEVDAAVLAKNQKGMTATQISMDNITLASSKVKAALAVQYEGKEGSAEYVSKLAAVSEAEKKQLQGATIMGQALDQFGANFAGTLNDMVWNAGSSFSEITTSFGKMITQLLIQEELAKPMVDMFKGMLSGVTTTGLTGILSGGGTTGSAKGNVFSGGDIIPYSRGGIFDNNTIIPFSRGSAIQNGNIIPFARGSIINQGNIVPFARGGVINSPVYFPLSKGMGLAGEAGPEAIMPLKRTSTGRLGVEGSMKFATGGVFDRIMSKALATGEALDEMRVRRFAAGGIFDHVMDATGSATKVFEHMRVKKFAAGGIGLAGEAGPEAIMPLKRLSNGNLGVATDGSTGGGNDVTVNVINNAKGTEATYTETKTANGGKQIDVIIDEIIAGKITGGSKTHTAIKNTFGLRVPTVGR